MASVSDSTVRSASSSAWTAVSDSRAPEPALAGASRSDAFRSRSRPATTTITTTTPTTIHIAYRTLSVNEQGVIDADELGSAAGQPRQLETAMPPRITAHPSATVPAPNTVTSAA